MRKQIFVVLGVLLAFGCADVPEDKQFAAGCSESSESVPENEYVAPAPAPSPTSGGNCAIDSLVELGRDGQVTISQNGKYVLQGLTGSLRRYNTLTGGYDSFALNNSRPYGNYAPAGITDDGNTVFIRTWNGYSVATQSDIGGGGRLYSFNLSTGQGQILDVDQNGDNMTYQGWSIDGEDIDFTPDGKYVVFVLRDLIDANNFDAGQQTHIYRKNTQTGEVTKVDTTTSDFEVGYSGRPRISDDGRYVVFNTNINLLNDPSHTGTSDSNVFRKDITNNSIIKITGYNDNGGNADISGDGTVIAFHTGSYTVSIWQNGTTTALLSNSLYPKVSPDGQYVTLHNTSAGGSQRLYNLSSGQFSPIPNVSYHTQGYFTSEGIEFIGDGGLLLWTWHDYKSTDTDGDADYYYYEYNCSN
jgi:hypothetical protein